MVFHAMHLTGCLVTPNGQLVSKTAQADGLAAQEIGWAHHVPAVLYTVEQVVINLLRGEISHFYLL
ncbi:hypothetical protein FQZ97_1194540 [compost metagenome]